MRLCADCEKPMKVTSNAQKRCVKCRPARNRYTHDRARVARGDRQSFGEGRGGQHNGGWKDGRSSKWYKRFKKKRCERCGGKRRLSVHHRDRDHSNSSPSNLETVCSPCHTREHLAEMLAGRRRKAAKTGRWKNYIPSERKAA